MQWGVLLWMGLFATALGMFWWVKGSARVDGGTLAVMNELHVPLGLLVNLLIWNRDADLGRMALGAAVILISLGLNRVGRCQQVAEGSGVQAEAGLMDWLVDGSRDLTELVLDTNVDKLSILPAGRRHEHATELLASDGMSRLLDQLSERYPERILIFDSPPLLVTTEARVLASYMGQIVMVVEAGRTPREAVTQALSTIESNEIIGLVLNKAHNVETSGYYQGYGYGAA